MTRIYVGTCAWSDHEGFYPKGLPKNQQITYYSQQFPIVEINSSYYRLMPRRNYELWADRTPEGFLFDVKPFKQITWHDRRNPPDDAQTAAFSTSLDPLRAADKLGAVHAQFPPWFKHEEDNVEYIRRLRGMFPMDRFGVEFRHRSWLEGDHVPALCDALAEADVALTVVDEPQLGSGSVPMVLEVTTPTLAIARFHGRNNKMWYAKVKRTAERFDYLYSDEELADWMPNVAKLAETAEEIHLLFNNNAHDFAVQNARQLRLLIGRAVGNELDATTEIAPAPADDEPQQGILL